MLTPLESQYDVRMSGTFPSDYTCNFHVLSNLLLIYICKLHWNLNTVKRRYFVLFSDGKLEYHEDEECAIRKVQLASPKPDTTSLRRNTTSLKPAITQNVFRLTYKSETIVEKSKGPLHICLNNGHKNKGSSVTGFSDHLDLIAPDENSKADWIIAFDRMISRIQREVNSGTTVDSLYRSQLNPDLT